MRIEDDVGYEDPVLEDADEILDDELQELDADQTSSNREDEEVKDKSAEVSPLRRSDRIKKRPTYLTENYI